MKLKRIMAIVLCFAMVLSTMSFSVFAEEAIMVDSTEAFLTALETDKQISLATDITVETAITVPDDVVIDLNEKTLYVNVENSHYNNVTIKNGNIVLGKDDVHVCDGYFLVNEGKTLELDSVNMSSADGGIKGYAVFHLKTGANLDVVSSTLNISDNEYEAGYIVYANESTATVDINDSTVTGANINGIVHATTIIENSTFAVVANEHGINRSAVTINDSTVTISGGAGRGITAQHGDLVINGNSIVNISDMGEATIELRNDRNLTVADTASVNVDVAVNNTTNGTITGTVTVEGASNGEASYVAYIGEQGYEKLQYAIDAVENGNTITLAADCAEDVTVVQATDVAFTIDGANNTMSGTITVDGKSAAYATAGLTIKNVNFDATGIAKDASINLGGSNATRYTSNVTVDNCTFTGTGNAKVAVKNYTGGCKNVTITNCTATGLHSLTQLKTSTNVTVTGCEVTDCKNGISLGSSTGVTISDNDMELSGYGVRADGGAEVTVTDCQIDAFIPVVVRNASANAALTFNGTNTMTESNTDGIWCAIGTSEYESNGVLPTAATASVDVTLNDTGLTESGVYDAYVVPATTHEVSTKAELDAAIAAADEGDIILLTADIDYGAAQLKIEKAITLDLGDKTLTNSFGYGGLALKGGCSIKNGTVAHKGTVCAIKAWDVVLMEDLVIDVAFKEEGKVIGGIVLQENCAGIDTIKNVTIQGAGLMNGIETYNCGNATEPVIGSMENVTIDAVGTGMLISAPCGTATNCDIKGGVSGIEIWIKGTYSASLELVNSDIEGGERAVYAHDEENSNPNIVNNGTITFIADAATTIESANGKPVECVFQRIEEEQIILSQNIIDLLPLEGTGEENEPYIIENLADLKLFRDTVNAGNTYAGKYVKLADDIDLGGMTWTPITQFSGKFNGNDFTISNFKIDATAGHAAFFYKTASGDGVTPASIENLILSDITATVGKNYRVAALVVSYNKTDIKDVTVKNLTVTTTGATSWIAGLACAGVMNSEVTMSNCTVENFTVNDEYGAQFISGITAVLQRNGSEADGTNVLDNLHVKNFKVIVNGIVANGSSTAVGGLVGQTQSVWQNPHFKNCSVTGLDVVASGRVDVGGFMAHPGSYTYVTDCTVAGKIDVTNVTSDANYAGGFFGDYGWGDNVSKGDHKVTNCSADVDIITKLATAGGFVGSGINTENRNKNITLTNCEAKGAITCVEGGTATIGGFAGNTDRGIYINCSAAQNPFIGKELNEDAIEIPVAAIGDTYYSDLHEAMVACKARETVLLIADVDLAGIEWEPVSFKGTFDGQDHVISNLTINKPGVSTTGFITSLNGAFKNVTFTNPTVTGGENTGVVAGRAGGSAALAENITVNGTIKVETTHSGYARTGVIVGGWAYGNYKNITVDGGDKAVSYIKHTGGGDGRYVAGIVGHADDVESYVNCTVKNISISGGWLCGGIAGPGPADGVASGCVVENVNVGANYSGGLFGWYFGDGTIEQSTIKDVAFTAGTTQNGAIGGYGLNPDATVTNVTIENVTNGSAALLEHVVKVNGTYYFDFEDAIEDAIEAGGDITLLADIEPSETIKVTNNITLDLNGKTISGTCNAGQAHLFMVNNGAELTIKDSSTEQTGKITYAGNNSTGWIVDVEGKLVLESGTLELTGTWDIGYAVDVRPNAWGTAYTEETAFVMNGGKIISSDGAVRVASSSADTYKDVSASFTMNGGEIEAAWDGVFVQQSNGAWDVLNVTINNGTIKSALNPIRFYGPAATSYVNGEDCVDIALNGGTLTYTGTEAREWLVDGILRIGGGVTADDFMKDCDVTASTIFAATTTASEGYKWNILNDTTMTLVPVVSYSFELVADKEELYEKGEEVTVTLNVNSTDADTFYSISGKLGFDDSKLEYTGGASTDGTIKVQQMYMGTDEGFAVGTYKTFTFKVLNDITANETLTFTMNGMVVGTEDDAFTQVEALEEATETVDLVAPYTVILPEELTGAPTVIHGNEYVVSVKVPNELHKNTTYTITYTCGENTGSKVVTANDSTFTVPAEDIVGPLSFEFTSENKLEVEVKNNFVTGHTLILVKGDAKGYLFNDNGTDYAMYQVGNYKYSDNNDKQARAWVVKGEMTKEQAFDLITIDEENDSVKIAEGHNVNAYAIPDGRINFLDATAAHASYQIRYDIPAMVRAYLASDVNADYQVTGTDVNAILTHADYVE